GRVRLERREDLARVTSAAAPGAGVVLSGASGCGKSALAKRWVEQLGASGEKFLWFDSQSFERLDYAAFVADLGLRHGFDELARLLPDARATVVLDGLDRLYDTRAFALVGAVLRAIRANEQGSPWRVLI